jgi:lipopolysaccharide export LptBFGC system permease protein LptF
MDIATKKRLLDFKKTSLLSKYFFRKVLNTYFVSIVIVFILLSSAVALQIVFKYSQFPIQIIFLLFIITTYQFAAYTFSMGFLSTIIYVINSLKITSELQSLYNIGYDNRILKAIFLKSAIVLSIILFLSFHFFIPFTNRKGNIMILKNISYLFEPTLLWKNSIEFPNFMLTYQKYRFNTLGGIKIIEWQENGITIIDSKKGYFRRNIQFLTLQLFNVKITIIKNNKIMGIIKKKRYFYRIDFAYMISKFIKSIKSNSSIYLLRELFLSDKLLDIKTTLYELGKRTALSLTPFNFFLLGMAIAIILPTPSLLLSQVVALLVVFSSFYSIMVIASKINVGILLINFALPFIPNILLFILAWVLSMFAGNFRR